MDLELGQHSVPLLQQLPLRPEQQVNHCSTVTVARAVVCAFNTTSHLILKFGEAITTIIQFSWARRQTQWRAEPHLGTGRVLEPFSFCVSAHLPQWSCPQLWGRTEPGRYEGV